MKNVKILGSGCKKCQVTAANIEKVCYDLDLTIELVKVTQPEEIMAYGVMKTPAVVIDEQVIHKGSVPTEEQIHSWFMA